MFNPFSIDAPYSENQIWDNLDVYATCQGTQEMLDLVHVIQTSDNYFCQLVGFPHDIGFVGYQAANGSENLPEGTYITGMSSYSDQPEGFNVMIYDKGTKASIFYGDYIRNTLVASVMDQDPVFSHFHKVYGLNMLMSPFIITKPGVLGWEIVNRSANNANIQMCLMCAVPVNQRTSSQVVVDKG